MAVTPRSSSAGSRRAAESKPARASTTAPKAAGTRKAAGSKTAARSKALGVDLGLSADDLLEMYRLVALARAVDERMWVLNRAGRIPFVISGQGHEGAQVGVTWALEKGKDWVAPFYRSIATCLTFGMSPRDIMTAQYATASDPSSGGRQMPGHYGSHAHNLVSVSSPVATQLLHAVGLALAAKIRKTGQVALTIMGEGSSNQGDVHEGLNFAAIHKLPFIFIVENNGYAISVPLARQVADSSVAGRAAGYGIPGVTVDGSDVLACYAAAREAVTRARAGDGPSLIECKVTRLTGHSSDDQQTKYRTEEELAADRSLDPLPKFREQLVEAGILTPEAETRIEDAIKEAVHDATEYAESQPDPQPSTAMKWVYAEDWPSEGPPAWGLGESPASTDDKPEPSEPAGEGVH
jgi:2-oxoisovalerate dehydrogenase E1 component alpha subunit